MLPHLIILLLIVLTFYLFQVKEPFSDLQVYGNLEEVCDGDIPVISASCNKVPNFPPGLMPKITNSIKVPEMPFSKLAPTEGDYSFVIPELKYDGIYSKKDGAWTTCPNDFKDLNTYATNNYFHMPQEELQGRTIIEPPECENYQTGYPPQAYCSTFS